MTDYDPEAILNDPDAPLIHKMYALINIDVRDNGTHWSKCANCGDPYVVEPGGSETVCSESCASQFTSYLMSGEV